jgi:hypothetical protein
MGFAAVQVNLPQRMGRLGRLMTHQPLTHVAPTVRQGTPGTQGSPSPQGTREVGSSGVQSVACQLPAVQRSWQHTCCLPQDLDSSQAIRLACRVSQKLRSEYSKLCSASCSGSTRIQMLFAVLGSMDRQHTSCPNWQLVFPHAIRPNSGWPVMVFVDAVLEASSCFASDATVASADTPRVALAGCLLEVGAAADTGRAAIAFEAGSTTEPVASGAAKAAAGLCTSGTAGPAVHAPIHRVQAGSAECRGNILRCGFLARPREVRWKLPLILSTWQALAIRNVDPIAGILGPMNGVSFRVECTRLF